MKSFPMSLLVLLTLLALFGSALPSFAATLTVPAQYGTIQAAVNAAANGDTVLIADGTYTGPGNVDVEFGGKNITVTSQHGPASTIIDCGGSPSVSHRGFYIHNNETAAVISGLTVQNANTTSGSTNGGAIATFNVTLMIQNCILKNNTAQDGAGISDYNYVGTVTVDHCLLTGNTATFEGGAIFNYNSSNGSTLVTNCTITNNKVAGGTGGGLENDNFGSGMISVVNCLLAGNSASHGGGADNLYSEGSGPILMTNCTFTNNTGKFDSGGVFNENTQGTSASPSAIFLTNDIFYGDNAGGGNAANREVTNNPSSTAFATVTYCDVLGGYAGTGNINADPLFVNPAGDLHLQPGSPCLGAGASAGAPPTDADGNPRPNPPSIGAFDRPGAARLSLTHMLWNNADGKVVLWNVTPDGKATIIGVYGPANDGPGTPNWTATAIATGPDGVTHMLWNNPDGKVVLWNVTPNGTATITGVYGPATDGPGTPNWAATALSIGPDNILHMLWNNPDGKVVLWSIPPGGAASIIGVYGPATDGPGTGNWAATAISTGTDGVTHMLWNNPDGKVVLWNVQADGTAAIVGVYGPGSDGPGTGNWSATALSTGPDNVTHMLWNNPDGKVVLWNVQGNGTASIIGVYGPATDGPGTGNWAAIAVSTGPDGLTHMVWNNPDGKVVLWNVSGDGTGSIIGVYGPGNDGPGTGNWVATSLTSGP